MKHAHCRGDLLNRKPLAGYGRKTKVVSPLHGYGKLLGRKGKPTHRTSTGEDSPRPAVCESWTRITAVLGPPC